MSLAMMPRLLCLVTPGPGSATVPAPSHQLQHFTDLSSALPGARAMTESMTRLLIQTPDKQRVHKL